MAGFQNPSDFRGKGTSVQTVPREGRSSERNRGGRVFRLGRPRRLAGVPDRRRRAAGLHRRKHPLRGTRGGGGVHLPRARGRGFGGVSVRKVRANRSREAVAALVPRAPAHPRKAFAHAGGNDRRRNGPAFHDRRRVRKRRCRGGMRGQGFPRPALVAQQQTRSPRRFFP